MAHDDRDNVSPAPPPGATAPEARCGIPPASGAATPTCCDASGASVSIVASSSNVADGQEPVSVSAFAGRRAFKVSGLDCAEEVAVLRKAVGPVVGGEDRLAFDVLNGRMTIADHAATVPDQAIVRAVADTGMNAVPWAVQTAGGRQDGRRLQVIFTIASGAFLVLALPSMSRWRAGSRRASRCSKAISAIPRSGRRSSPMLPRSRLARAS